MARGRGGLTPSELEIRKIISNNLNDFLSKTNKKQIDVHNATGIPKSTLTGYFKGTSLPNGGNVQKLADFFDVKKSEIDPRYSSIIKENDNKKNVELEDTLETMGDRIKRLRKANGLTQEELGNKVGLKRAAINKYEKGNVENIKRSIIEKMSTIFEVSPSYLMALDNFDEEQKMYDNFFPQRLKEARKEKKYSLETLAQKVNTSKTALSRYENGTRSPKIGTVAKLANTLDVELNWLSGLDEGKEIKDADKIELSQDEIELIKNYRKCNRDNKMKLQAYSEAMADASDTDDGHVKGGLIS